MKTMVFCSVAHAVLHWITKGCVQLTNILSKPHTFRAKRSENTGSQQTLKSSLDCKTAAQVSQ